MDGKSIWRVKWQCYIATIGVVPAVNYLEGIKRVSPLKCNVGKGGEYVLARKHRTTSTEQTSQNHQFRVHNDAE